MIQAHCNRCGGERNHDVLHSERSAWTSFAVSGSETYQTLKCLGCDAIKLRIVVSESESDKDRVYYFPPATFRPKPKWMLYDLWTETTKQEEFVEPLLSEIYTALHQGLSRLAAMGIRSLLERIMISKTGDQGSFAKNLLEFERLGYVSNTQSTRLTAILEAGHAAIHREYTPSKVDLATLLDITEHIVEAIFIHEGKVAELRRNVPPRKGKDRR